VCGDENDEPVEIPTESDGKLNDSSEVFMTVVNPQALYLSHL